MLNKINEKTAELLEMPKDCAVDIPKITINGFGELFCEGCKGIRVCREDEIRFAVSGGAVSVRGSGLMIKSIDEDEIGISGRISVIDFI